MRNVIGDWLWGGAVTFLFIIDRVVKTALTTGVGETIIARAPFHLTERINRAGALSFPFLNSVVAFVSGALVLILIIYFFKSIEVGRYDRARSLLSVIAGASSNLIDRAFAGGVVDYIAIAPGLPVFNLSDILITAGLVGWFVISFKRQKT